MTLLSQEGSQVALIDGSLCVAIDSLESCIRREVVAILKLSLQSIESSCHFDFSLKNACNASLDIQWKILIPGHSE